MPIRFTDKDKTQTAPDARKMGRDVDFNEIKSVINSTVSKDSVRVATTANGTLASAFANGSSVDGVALATGDRILIKDQTAQAENGIYVVAASGAPSRDVDADTGTKLNQANVSVREGTVNGGTRWRQTNNNVTVGSGAIVFIKLENFSNETIVVKTANYTLGAAEAAMINFGYDVMMEMDSASPLDLILVNNSTQAIAVGRGVRWRQKGAGQLTVTNDSGVTVLSPNNARKAFAQYSEGYARKVATNTWILGGDLTV